MIPELPISMLASARLGALHSVIFAGFTAQAVASRVNDSRSKIVITSDGACRKGKIIELKPIADEALKQTAGIEKIVVVRRSNNPITMTDGRDIWYHKSPRVLV